MSIAKSLVLVTGATDGIGRETVRRLAGSGAGVLVHGRCAERVDATVDELTRTGASARGLVADFRSLESVRALATSVLDHHGRLDVLINNAGLWTEHFQRSDDGFELTFAVNYLAPFLLTHLLLPALSTAPEGRIVNVSSSAHHRARLDLTDLDSSRSFNSQTAYDRSKLADLMFTLELARRLGSRPTVNALHPGTVTTKLLLQGWRRTGRDPIHAAADGLVKAALAPELAGQTGLYLVAGESAPPSRGARHRPVTRLLYTQSSALVGIEPLPDPDLDPISGPTSLPLSQRAEDPDGPSA